MYLNVRMQVYTYIRSPTITRDIHNMHVHTDAYRYAYIYLQTYKYAFVRVHAYTHKYTDSYSHITLACIYIYAHISGGNRSWTNASIDTYTCAYMHTRTSIRIHTHTRIRWKLQLNDWSVLQLFVVCASVVYMCVFACVCVYMYVYVCV